MSRLAEAMIEFLSLWYPLLLPIVAVVMMVWHHRSYVKWYNSPEVVNERQKAAYEEAHAYTKGTCCCVRAKD